MRAPRTTTVTVKTVKPKRARAKGDATIAEPARKATPAKAARKPRQPAAVEARPLAPPPPPPPAPAPAPSVALDKGRGRLRMYRHGLGDCLLVSLPRASGADYHILIDCGVILGTPDAAAKMKAVVDDVAAETKGHVDLLVITHEHWDHLSGFIQAKDSFAKIAFGAVWVAWTEDPQDPLATQLRDERESAIAALTRCAAALALGGADSPEARTVHDMLGFFGAAGAGSTKDAFAAAKAKAPMRFCRASDAPVHLGDPDVRIYVLGPPHDAKLIRKTLVSPSSPETYGLALDGTAIFRADVGAALAPDALAPFDDIYTIPVDIARGDAFFRQFLWGGGADAPDWRSIDTDWLQGASDLALALDSATNNTSLVLALEFPDGDVALLVGDAQVGNWESWQALTWSLGGGRVVTGPDLLRRTTFYKVGHHGSHNATLRAGGLEAMASLKTAAIPVDHEMAVKKRWGRMPLPALVDALTAKTGGRMLRTDATPAGPMTGIAVDPLFFDIAL